jgi:hypothetical protein
MLWSRKQRENNEEPILGKRMLPNWRRSKAGARLAIINLDMDVSSRVRGFQQLKSGLSYLKLIAREAD